MKKIFSDPDGIKLGYYKSLLESNGIHAFIKNDNLSSIMSPLLLAITCPELWVINDDDFDKALEFFETLKTSENNTKLNIFVGTKNTHKVAEISKILEISGVNIIIPEDTGGIPDVEENGTSFEENASIKAIAYAKFAEDALPDIDGKLMAIADDSGLEVEALGGAPGIYSSRYAENDEKRIKKLLVELAETNERNGESKRRAKFVSVIAIANEEFVLNTFRGEVRGVIIDEPRGSNGFGYDPIFVPDGHKMTFAELPSEVKNRISHRANALKNLELYLNSNREKVK